MLVLLDLSAAFDMVEHALLLEALEKRFGIHGMTLTSYRSYLTERTQTFHVGRERSSTFVVSCSVPQGSVLDPMKCIAYTEDLPAVIEKRSVDPYLYADDGQLNVHLRINDVNAALKNLETCVGDVQNWCASKRLQPNPSNSEVIWFGTSNSLKMFSGTNLCLRIETDTNSPTKIIRDLGVLLMTTHVNKISGVCFYQLRRLKRIRRILGPDITARLVSAYIISRLDYLNSVLAGLPKSTTAPLQRVQNSAARLVKRLGPRIRISSAFRDLHWLLVNFHIAYKLCLMMHATIIIVVRSTSADW